MGGRIKHVSEIKTFILIITLECYMTTTVTN